MLAWMGQKRETNALVLQQDLLQAERNTLHPPKFWEHKKKTWFAGETHMKDVEDSDLRLENVETRGNRCSEVSVENHFVQVCI